MVYLCVACVGPPNLQEITGRTSGIEAGGVMDGTYFVRNKERDPHGSRLDPSWIPQRRRHGTNTLVTSDLSGHVVGVSSKTISSPLSLRPCASPQRTFSAPSTLSHPHTTRHAAALLQPR